tara:strand:+ start:11609 stop:13585 length:1977 start_codon:yes stop_codon:yes gene_type:complete
MAEEKKKRNLIQDTKDAKKKGLSKLQNFGNVIKAKKDLARETALKNVMGSIDSINEKSNNLIEYFLDLIKVGGGNESITRIRKNLVKKLGKYEPEVKEIVFEEMVQFLNCDLNFVIPSANGTNNGNCVVNGGVSTVDANLLKIPVKSIDPFGLLKNSPLSNVGKATYEKQDIVTGSFPFSANKGLYGRLENPSTQEDYMGFSGNRLFTIEFDGVDSYLVRPVGVDNTFSDNNIADFGCGGAENDRKVTDFMRDYYDSVKIFEKHNFLAQIFEVLMGSLSVQIDRSGKEVELDGKFAEIIKRILGMCGDDEDGSDGGEISTSATAHLTDTYEGEEEDFFAFGPQDLLNLEDETSLKVKGLMRFASCDNIETGINVDQLNEDINGILSESNEGIIDMNLNQSIDKAVESMGDDTLSFNLPNIKADFDANILKELPKILINLILTPKVLLPIAIAMKSQGNSFDNNDIMDLVKKFFRLIKKIVRRLFKLMIEILFDEIKRIILQLIAQIMKEIIKEKYLKQFAIIQNLLNLLMLALQLIEDLANCKSILNSLLQLLRLPPPPGGINIPKPLLFATASRPGFSDTRAFQNVLENLQETGFNTADHADGSPNASVVMLYNSIRGVEKERSENSVVKIVTYPQNVKSPQGPGVTESGTGTGLIV